RGAGDGASVEDFGQGAEQRELVGIELVLAGKLPNQVGGVPRGGHSFDGLPGRMHRRQRFGGRLTTAEANTKDLVPAGEPGDLEVADASEALNGRGVTAEDRRELGHLAHRPGEGRCLQVVPWRVLPDLAESVADTERDRV